jgi:hypothetical protein
MMSTEKRASSVLSNYLAPVVLTVTGILLTSAERIKVTKYFPHTYVETGQHMFSVARFLCAFTYSRDRPSVYCVNTFTCETFGLQRYCDIITNITWKF